MLGLFAPGQAYPGRGQTFGVSNLLQADTGSYAVTGSAATFVRATRLSAETGAYTITGSAATLKAAVKLVVDAGVYAITGSAALFLEGFAIVADAGSYAITGSAAGLRKAWKLLVDAGAYVLSGLAATLLHTSTSTINVFAAGANITAGIDLTTLRKEETNDAVTSNTCTFEYRGDTPPTALQEIVVRRATTAVEFAGTILSIKQFYYGIRHNIGWRITCQDFTWLFNDGRYSFKWSGAVSASTIAAAIVAFKSGFTSTHVEAGLATVTDFEIINKTRGEALQLLADLVGATIVKIGYDLDVHFRVTPEAVDLPDDVTDLTRSGDDLVRTSESGQIRTRQRGWGVRVRIPSLIPAGSTTISVEAVDKLPASGQLQIGSRIITFTAQSQTQTPSGIAGVAAAPTVALASSPAGGVLGAVRYCVTFETPDGETPPGAQSSQVTGSTIAAPGTGTASLQHSVGTGGGSTDYYTNTIFISRSGTSFSFGLSGAVVGARVHIFGTSTGVFEGTWTVAAVSGSTVTVDGVSASAPSSDSGKVQLMTAGPHTSTVLYKFGWISPLGISALGGPFAPSLTPGHANISVGVNTTTQTTGGSLTTNSFYRYFYTGYTELGETSPRELSNPFLTGGNTAISFSIQTLHGLDGWSDLRIRGLRLYRSRAGETFPRLLVDYSRAALVALGAFNGSWTYLDTTADTALGELPASGGTGAAIGVTLPTWSDSRITGLAILRTTAADLSTFYVHSILSSALVTTLLDTMSDAQLLQQSPVPADTFGGHSVALSNIATLSGATARNIYRLFNGVWRYCGTIPDNVTTTFTDKKADTELGAPLKIAGYLTGLSALSADIVAGEIARLHVVRSDAAAAAIVATAMGRGDGFFEGPVLDDDTLGQTALAAACDAEIATFSAALRSVTFRSRDVELQPGKTITFNLGGTTNIVGTFTIQRVVTSEMDIAEGRDPLRTVTAGPVLATLRKSLAA